jgi:hypothetical protein
MTRLSFWAGVGDYKKYRLPNMNHHGRLKAAIIVGLILPLLFTSLVWLSPSYQLATTPLSPPPIIAVDGSGVIAHANEATTATTATTMIPMSITTTKTMSSNRTSNNINVNVDCTMLRQEVFDRYEFKKESELSECAIQCIQFYANGTFSVQSLYPEMLHSDCYWHYWGVASIFLQNLTSTATTTTTINHSPTTLTTTTGDDDDGDDDRILIGTAVAWTVDLVQFSSALIAQLHQRHVPVLAHAIAKTQVKEKGVVLIPDFQFIEQQGWSTLVATMRENGRPLRERSETIYWRGSTTGLDCDIDRATIDVSDPSQLRDPCGGCHSLPRIAAVQIAQTTNHNRQLLDLAITKAVQNCSSDQLRELFPSGGVQEDEAFAVTQQGVGDPPHNELDWIKARGILDLDGNANAWGTRWRLESGSVLFKVDSPITNAYLERLVPYVHYIPIHANLSNLVSQAMIVRGDLVVPSLEIMVENAKSLMAEFTYEKEVRRVRNELLAFWS